MTLIVSLSVSVFLQALSMLVDEFIFHRRRGLPRFERVGHPVDTLSVALCLGSMLSLAPSKPNGWAILFLIVFSSLLITKDEWVHARFCCGAEHWLHSLLFILHPLVLFQDAALWFRAHDHLTGISLVDAVDPAIAVAVLWLQLGMVSVFMLYQAGYWNWIWKGEVRSHARGQKAGR